MACGVLFAIPEYDRVVSITQSFGSIFVWIGKDAKDEKDV